MAFDVPANGSIKDYLDIGSRSLLYFENFEPRYRRAFNGGDLPAGFPTYAQLHQRHYEQNGLNEGKLLDLAAKLQIVLQEAGGERDTQRGYARTLPALWQGDAASAALDMLNKQVAHADTDWQAASGAWKQIAGASAALRAAVKVKAEAVRYILESGEFVKIAGKTPEDIDSIISGRSMGWSNSLGSGSLLSELRVIFPDLNDNGGPFVGTGSGERERVKIRCKNWLNEVFKPDYLDKVQKFNASCDLADSGVKKVYDRLIQELDKVSDTRYERPAGVAMPEKNNSNSNNNSSDNNSSSNKSDNGSSNNSSNGVSGTPSTNTDTASTQNPSKTDTTTSPSSTTTASTNPLQGLATLTQSASQLSSLAQTVGEGLASLGTSIKSGVDSAIEQVTKSLESAKSEDNDGDGTTDTKNKTAAEFDLGGKHMKVEIGPDGVPTLVMTDADGKTHEFGVKLDEKGFPVITTDELKAEGDPPTSAGGAPVPDVNSKKPDGGTSTPEEDSSEQPGTVPKVPQTGPREEDGEHTPQQFPEGNPEPEDPADSGAELAEAGPL